MLTPSATTKTKALCVATRCTSVDQFVATFYRFCGDDQTFFVATMTSRPIGLETAFSIQLSDKQPVLRGLCVVLDTWGTADNRYKRPGIRLGIKRLTADSQLVFDRMRAAARAPDALPEATPPPGAAPMAAAAAAAAASSTAGPVLPPLTGPRLGLPMTRAQSVSSLPSLAKPGVSVKPAVAIPSISPIPSIARPAAVAPPAPVPAPAPAPALAPAPVADAEPAADAVPDAEYRRQQALTPPPVAVRRFQVALNVGTIPPPISEDDFNQQLLLRRQKSSQPKISGDEADDAPVDAGNPAVIVDRPPEAAPAAAAPAPMPSQDTAPNHVATETRTPGSSLVLPANPLHNLSDESLEGFVDCTLYEETGGFAPADGDWHDELLDPPAPAPTVPAMPFDQPPELTVRASGDNESLRVAPERLKLPEPVNRPPTVPGPLSSTDALFAPLHDRASTAAPWLESASAALSGPHYTPGSQDPIARELPEVAPPPPTQTLPHIPATGPLAIDPGYGAVGYTIPSYEPPRPVYPAMAGYAPFPGSLPIALPAPPPPRPAWQRALLITSTVAVAIVLAFMIARHVRGPAEPAAAPARADDRAASLDPAALRQRAARRRVRLRPPGRGRDRRRGWLGRLRR